jgi:hypothetical protein
VTVRRARILAAALIGAACALASGCGYSAGNRRGARVVALAFVDAYSRHDAPLVCRVILPGLAAQFAAESHGTCEQHVEATFSRAPAPVSLGSARLITETSALLSVDGNPPEHVRLLKLGSIWRVSEAWDLR